MGWRWMDGWKEKPTFSATVLRAVFLRYAARATALRIGHVAYTRALCLTHYAPPIISLTMLQMTKASDVAPASL